MNFCIVYTKAIKTATNIFDLMRIMMITLDYRQQLKYCAHHNITVNYLIILYFYCWKNMGLYFLSFSKIHNKTFMRTMNLTVLKTE